MASPKGTELIKDFEKARATRYNFEGQWQDIRELVRPNTADFNRNTTQGASRVDNIFDGTAPWALEQFSAGLNSAMSSPTERWFNVALAEMKEDLEDEVLEWLEHVSDRIFREYARPQTSLNPNIHEVYQDLGAFGTGVLYQDWNHRGRHVFFRAFPLADCYIKEDSNGIVNTMHRMTVMTTAQIREEFDMKDDYIPAKIMEEKDIDKQWHVIHCVTPRELKNYGQGSKQKRFASYWVVQELKEVLRERGYDEFPYHVPRWTKLAGEIYGRSPAMTCLPDIRMLNTMSKVVIKAAQKIVDPPLIVPDDGFMLPIKTSPGSLIFKSAGQEDTIQPLPGGDPRLGLDMMEQRREHIVKSFYIDWIIRQKKRERQTATEVMDDRNEMLRQMSPMLGRTQVELHSPMIIRTYNLLNAAGEIRPAPAAMDGKKLDLVYISPAAKAQTGSKGANMQMFIQDLATLTPISPEIMDAVDTDALAQALSVTRDVSRKIIRSPDEIAAIRDQRSKANQLQQATTAGRDIAATAKDLSVAQRNGLS